MKALSELSNRCDPVVWSHILEDLRRLSEGRSLENSPEWTKQPLFEDGDLIQEEERTWQDPSAHKMRVAVSSWTSDEFPRRKVVKVCRSSLGPLLSAVTLSRCRSHVIGLTLFLTTPNCLEHWENAHPSQRSTIVISSNCSYQPHMNPPQRTTDAS